MRTAPLSFPSVTFPLSKNPLILNSQSAASFPHRVGGGVGHPGHPSQNGSRSLRLSTPREPLHSGGPQPKKTLRGTGCPLASAASSSWFHSKQESRDTCPSRECPALGGLTSRSCGLFQRLSLKDFSLAKWHTSGGGGQPHSALPFRGFIEGFLVRRCSQCPYIYLVLYTPNFMPQMHVLNQIPLFWTSRSQVRWGELSPAMLS